MRAVIRSIRGLLLSAIAVTAQAAPILYVDDGNGVLGRVDVATGNVVIVGNTGLGGDLIDIAFSPTGVLYGITSTNLYRISTTNAAATLVGAVGGQFLNSLVFSSTGVLYGANSSLYTINPMTGAATLVGNGGAAYASSGDLAFVGGLLYLSSNLPSADTLDRLNPLTGAATVVGSIGVSAVYGLASSDNVNLFGVSGTNVYAINPTTGASTLVVNYGGRGLGSANGTAFLSESGAVVPEPETMALLGLGATLVAFTRRRRSAEAASR